MPELDDVILPDDFEAPPQAEEPNQEPQEPAETNEVQPEVEDTKPTEEEPVTPTAEPETPRVKVKYNHEELDLSLEEAAQLAQKGMNYDKAVERARQEAAQQARDEWIAEQGYTWNGKPITTESEYKQAMAEQELINKYQDRDMPEEVIKELLENRRFREEALREKQAREEQQKRDSMLNEFLEYFQGINGRPYNATTDKLPKEVQDAFSKGTPLKIAYMEYHNKELMNQLKIARQNEENLKKAPVGSVTANGGNKTEPEDDFLRGFNSID